MKKNKSARLEDLGFNIFNFVFLGIFITCVVYPFIYTINLSLSNTSQAMQGGMFLLPKGFELNSYRQVLTSKFIGYGYMNSLYVTTAGTVLQVLFTSLMAYPLSKKRLYGRDLINKMVVFTMLFTGGLIPTFLTVKATGLLDSHMALILPILISPFNLIILRSFFSNIPDSLEESAMLDGANDLHVFFLIVIPLSKAAFATIALWSAVYLWNDFFNCLVYIQDRGKYVLQLMLREIVSSANLASMMDAEAGDQMQNTPETLKAASIMIVTIPILMIYPFVQKYFVKGAMIGSVKG